MSSINELVDDVLWRELVQHMERRKPTVSYRRPVVDLKMHYVVHDDKIVKRSGIRNAHSLVANFLSYLGFAWNYNVGILSNDGKPYATENSTYGIVVGTGTQTKSVNLTDLGSPISPSSTGLVYGTESYTGPIPINNYASAVLREIRTFTNNSTSNYTLSEIGIYGNTYGIVATLTGVSGVTGSSKFSNVALVAYDLLSPPVVVQPSQTVTFEYDWIVNV